MVSLNLMRWGSDQAGRTAVALHGITANGGAMTAPARLMAERGWRLLCPDMRGHGESPRGDADFSFDALLADIAAAVPPEPDLLIGHSFGGTLAQLAVLRGVLRPKALLLEDPVSHFADKATPKAMLDWDEANLPHGIEGLQALNPLWSRRDAAWKLLSMEQVAFDDASTIFSGNAPWDLRPETKAIAARQPTLWLLPEASRVVTDEDLARLRAEL